MNQGASAEFRWWQKGVVYQIYPWSFMDSNADGVGDLEGVRQRLGYLSWLGIDAIWISPIYPSPMCDFGYDVSDYCDVDPRFGTLSDFDALVADAHALGIKVILDYVPNHTSDQHPWFQEAQSSRTNSKRDWYIWSNPGTNGGAPNNWLSEFGGSAWQWHEATGQYYYHAYLKEQPDLNWRNPEVRAAMHEVLRFWLNRGVDGFRVDTIHHLIKDAELRDNPPNPDFTPSMPPHRRLIRRFTTDQPEVHEEIARMRQVLDDYRDRVLIGEAWLPYDRLMAYYGVDLTGLHLPFNFHLINAKWEATVLATLAREYESALPGGAWPNWVLGNHDRSRIATRVGDAQARVAAVLLLTLRGTPTLYYGDEIGMRDVPVPSDQARDPFEKNVPGLGVGRDPERTPMQWGPGDHAEFSSVSPWLPLDSEFAKRNVTVQRNAPESMLTLYAALIRLRRAEQALSVGRYDALEVGPDIYGYKRTYGTRSLGVFLNLTSKPRQVVIPGSSSKRVLLSTIPGRTGTHLRQDEALLADEGLIVEL